MPNDDLTNSIRRFTAGLSPQEQSALSEHERAAMIAETQDLIIKSRRNKGGATMGMTNRTAQATPPPVGAPPTGTPPVTGQLDQPPAAEPPAAAPPAATPPPASPEPRAAEEMPPAEPNATVPAPMDAEAQMANGISEYIDEVEDDKGGMSGDEMGLEEPTRVAAYVQTYGHLRIRPTTANVLEVYDPNTSKMVMQVSPNASTRRDAQKLRRCAVNVLATIAHHGLVRTAKLWKAKVRNASGGIVDYGATSTAEKPKATDNSLNDRGETNMQEDISLGVDSTTGKGDNLAAKEQPETREPKGASKSAQSKTDGILPGTDTNLADDEPSGDPKSVLTDAETNMTDERPSKSKGSDSTLDDAITTFANESLTASMKPRTAQDTNGGMPMPGTPPPPEPQVAQALPGEEDAPAPGMGADVIPGEDPNAIAPEPGMPPSPDMPGADVEAKFARLYSKRAEKQIAAAQREFVAKFVRCVRLAARRQALNLEPNQLKIAVADALMSEAALSKHEVYSGMDARTATFVIERGLDQRNALAFVDSLIKRSAAFMKMSDEALTQIEDDVNEIQPVAPGEIEGQAVNPGEPSVMPQMPQMAQDEPPMDPMGQPANPMLPPDWAEQEMQEPEHQEGAEDPGVMGMPPANMELDEGQRAANLRRAAAGGNLPVNPSAPAPGQPQGASKRDQIRFAVAATKNACLRNAFGGR